MAGLLLHRFLGISLGWIVCANAFAFLVAVYGLKLLRGVQVSPQDVLFLHLFALVSLLSAGSLFFSSLGYLWISVALFSMFIRYPFFLLRRKGWSYLFLFLIGFFLTIF